MACDTILVEQKEIPIDPNNHTNIVVDKAVEATCTKTGLTEGKHCEDCKAVIVKQNTVPMKDHIVVIDKAVESTCKATGLTEGKHCSVCNTVIVKQEVTPKKEHNIVIDPAAAPTCTKDGLTEGKHCGTCGTIFTARETVPATGHADNNGDGKCDNCGVSLNPSEGCSCACHKGGFSGFIYKIARFFWKLFKIHQTCECGVKHY